MAGDEIGGDRLDELMSAALTEERGASLATIVRRLVGSVQAKPVDSGPRWGWIGAVLAVLALGSLAPFDRLVRRRP